MTYSFPSQLASVVTERWHSFVSRHDREPPALPEASTLRYILETAFFASLEREEGRALHFVLCCAPSARVVRDGSDEAVPLIPFKPARPFTVDSIRSLAPAVSPGNAALLIRCPDTHDDTQPVQIAGVLHIGADLARARAGRSFYYRPAPYTLTVDVRGPGELHVYQGGIKLAALRAGRVADQAIVSALEFVHANDILRNGERSLWSRITEPEHEPGREWAEFQWMALLNTILSVVNGVREHGHGGTVLLVSPDSAENLPVRIKYGLEVDANFLDDRFVDFINARHRLADAQWLREGNLDQAPDEDKLALLGSAAFAAERELADAADLVARLSAVDGALVLSSGLRVLGFGAEIVLDAVPPITAHEVSGDPLRSAEWPAVDSESFGMRHRSAIRFVAATADAAAFLLSHDGTASFCWKSKGQVFLKRYVNIANPNMVGA